jgi:hypothetical protein
MHGFSLFKGFVSFLSATALIACLAGETRADIPWTWSYASEAGTFVTDGELACDESAPAGTYTILDFSVTASAFPGNVGSLSGGEYSENQPVQGFTWDGTQPTQWFRASGVFTNGSNFYRVGTDLRYLFAPASYGIDDIVVNPGEFLVFSDAIEMESVVDPCPTPTPTSTPTPTPRPGKVVLCHKGRRALEVGATSVPAHLAHGDTLGPCE